MDDKLKITVTKKDLEDKTKTSELTKLKQKNPDIDFELEPETETSGISIFGEVENLQPDAVIEPQDQETIKYLSNVKDIKTGKISQPFTIKDKRYQMVRGIYPDGKISLAVFCHDDLNDIGENIIHSMDYFEENFVKPITELDSPKTNGSETYEGFKHFLVNKQTNEIRKFKSIEEMLSSEKSVDEEYMGVSKLKKYMNERLFGARKKSEERLSEVTPSGEENDEEMNLKAKKLMDLIGKRIPQNIIKTIKTPLAQREVIAAFAELIGVPRNGLTQLLSNLKDISKREEEPITERKIITKQKLEETITNKVIKKIKVKDIINEQL